MCQDDTRKSHKQLDFYKYFLVFIKILICIILYCIFKILFGIIDFAQDMRFSEMLSDGIRRLAAAGRIAPTFAAFGRLVGASPDLARKWATGERFPSEAELRKLARLLRLPDWYLAMAIVAERSSLPGLRRLARALLRAGPRFDARALTRLSRTAELANALEQVARAIRAAALELRALEAKLARLEKLAARRRAR